MGGRGLEERVEGFLHRGAVTVDIARERGPVFAAHGFGDERPVGRLARERLGLLVVEVLQAVLEAAQEVVRLAECGRTRALDQPALGEGAQRGARGRRAQRRVAPAAHHLEELHREFHLADAPRCPP